MWPFNKKKKEESHFNVGDTVKCIDDREWNRIAQSVNLVFGHTYKIRQIIKCPSCGGYSYDIGCRFDNKSLFTSCTLNGTQIDMPGQGIHWAGNFRFARFEESELSTAQLKEIIAGYVKNDEFEKAIEYKKILEEKEN
ncbi:MAG TPA: hypothetical protein VNX68_01190, partial [Nitrosopumilaceae archaeon]|jgi:hypothetical protein|nr:hypothetical protein [Nitrosopumilaceae archaeon]